MKPDPAYQRVDACRVCGGQNLTEILDFGEPYISDFVADPAAGVQAPLLVARCEDCTLVQLRHTVDPQVLFERYWYRSGVNETMVTALADVVREATERVTLGPDDRVLDIGANDGTLLRHYPAGVRKIAFEPSDVAGAAPNSHWVQDLFPPHTYRARAACGEGPFKVITSVAMFYAVDEPQAFVAAIRRMLHPDGVWIVQLQDLEHVLRDRAFDYFCHEHLALYSLHSFERLIHQHGLEIRDWSTNLVNGGSLRIVVGHGAGLSIPRSYVDGREAWQAFRSDVLANKSACVRYLAGLQRQGRKVGGYAASTKANTVLQFFGIGPDLLPWIAERSPEKVGLRTVGSGIPIISEGEARRLAPDVYVALAWQFLEAFRARESGTPFLTLLPELASHPSLTGRVQLVA